MNKKEISVLLSLIITTVLSVFGSYIHEAETIRNNTLRLHIIANSDSAYDQQCKLNVKDEILSMEDILPDNAENYAKALSVAQNNLGEIENRINRFLKENRAGYSASCSIENFYFDTTKYNGFALPQGEYTALTVRLGSAQGKNWWCVMYPALCSESCGEAALNSGSDFIVTEKLTPRFKVVELYQNIKKAVLGTDAKKYDKI